MDDETHPSTPPQTRPTSRNRARPSMGGSGLFGTPKPSPSNNTITPEELEFTDMIQQASNQPPTSPEPSMEQDVHMLDESNFHSLFNKIGTRIHLDALIRSNGGVIAQLDPVTPGIVHMSKNGTILSELTPSDIISANLGMNASKEAPKHHTLIFVLLAQLSLNNPGRAAAILTHSPWTVAATNNDDIFVLDVSHIGLGRIAIIDEGSEESQISEITEAVTQMTGPAVVIRNQFVLGFGPDLVSIASNLTKLEQEMQRKQLRN
ncbi:MAG: class II aldolase/adducin family protein [Candidatus Thermoplasmatota archaeon]|nr:class II aldolase/adducin family protein [Candidatus Thermoplasmatota archaeon]